MKYLNKNETFENDITELEQKNMAILHIEIDKESGNTESAILNIRGDELQKTLIILLAKTICNKLDKEEFHDFMKDVELKAYMIKELDEIKNEENYSIETMMKIIELATKIMK